MQAWRVHFRWANHVISCDVWYEVIVESFSPEYQMQYSIAGLQDAENVLRVDLRYGLAASVCLGGCTTLGVGRTYGVLRYN